MNFMILRLARSFSSLRQVVPLVAGLSLIIHLKLATCFTNKVKLGQLVSSNANKKLKLRKSSRLRQFSLQFKLPKSSRKSSKLRLSKSLSG
jgi:hypothetical protein